MTTVTNLDTEQITAYLAECKVIPEYSVINVVGQVDYGIVFFIIWLLFMFILLYILSN